MAERPKIGVEWHIELGGSEEDGHQWPILAREGQCRHKSASKSPSPSKSARAMARVLGLSSWPMSQKKVASQPKTASILSANSAQNGVGTTGAGCSKLEAPGGSWVGSVQTISWRRWRQLRPAVVPAGLGCDSAARQPRPTRSGSRRARPAGQFHTAYTGGPAPKWVVRPAAC